MPDEPRQTVADLEAAMLVQQRQQYERLQRAAAETAFQRKHGRPAADLGELERAFKSGTVTTIDPTRYLDEAAVRRVLASATGSTATG